MNEKYRVRMRLTFRSGGLTLEFDPNHLVWVAIEEIVIKE